MISVSLLSSEAFLGLRIQIPMIFKVKEQNTHRTCTLLALGDLAIEMGFSQSQLGIYEAKFHLNVILNA